MAVNSGSAAGYAPITSTVLTQSSGEIPLVDGGTITVELQGDGCPTFNVWTLQSSGSAGVTVSPQFLNRPTEFEEFVAPIALAVGTPLLANYHLGAARYRIQIFNGSGAPATIKYRITATPNS